MNWLRGMAYKYLGAAFMEDKGSGPVASLGRYFAVPTMGAMLYKMTTGGAENPITMMDAAVLAMLLGYNGWSKFTAARKG